MTEVTGRNFGLLIAYVLPGFVSLCGVAEVSPVVRSWLLTGSMMNKSGATVGGFLNLTLASVAAGLTVSTIRWAVVDRIHHATGITKPEWNDSVLQEKLDAFEALVENHYRYYQFYANMVIALLLLLTTRFGVSSRCISDLESLDCGLLFITLVYWAGSRNTLQHYYRRAAFLLGTRNGDNNDDEWT